jgi:hypothetical protein
MEQLEIGSSSDNWNGFLKNKRRREPTAPSKAEYYIMGIEALTEIL